MNIVKLIFLPNSKAHLSVHEQEELRANKLEAIRELNYQPFLVRTDEGS